MEYVRHFVQKKITKAYGLMQVFKEILLPEITADLESGPLNPSQSSINDAFENASEPDNTHVPDTLSSSNGIKNEEGKVPQPNFTKGRARFIVANDGSEDCMALLVTSTLMEKLADFFEERLQLEIMSGPLEHARYDAQEAQQSLEGAKERLGKAESQEKMDELQKFIEQQGTKLSRACQRKEKLEEHSLRVQNSVNLSRDHTQWVLESAMKEANLLKPHSTPSLDFLDEDESDNGSTASLARGSICSASEDNVETPLSEEEVERQAALEEFERRARTLDVVQAKFDNQRNAYEDNLTRFEQEVNDGTCNYSRSDFDRRAVEYGSKITRALIDAEEAFDQVEAYAKAIGAIDSQYGQPYGLYEESLPNEHMAAYIATKDWGFVHKWLAEVPDHDWLEDPNSQRNSEDAEHGECREGQNGSKSATGTEEGDWDVPEVEIQDSASAIDFDFNRKHLDRWQQLCAQPLPEASPEAWDTWPETFHMWPVNETERRHSF